MMTSEEMQLRLLKIILGVLAAVLLIALVVVDK